MRRSLKPAVLSLIVLLGTGCSSGRITKLETSVQENQTLLRETAGRIDAQASQIKELEGSVEQLNTKLADIEKRLDSSIAETETSVQEVKDNLTFLSDQIARLDKSLQGAKPRPRPSSTSAFKPGGFNVEASYNTALDEYKARRYESAISGFKEVLTVAAGTSVGDNAQYWIGECYDALGSYDKALEAFNKVFDFPKSNKLPDAHLKIGLIYEKTGKKDLAKEEFKTVVDNYPGTNAATIAAAHLKALGE